MKSNTTVLVTGANGFVGMALCTELNLDESFNIIPLARNLTSSSYKLCPDLNSTSDWSHLLSGVDVVVHLAGKAHDLSGSSTLDDYRLINTVGTINLAEQAVKAGIQKFIFVSTIGVHGSVLGKEIITESSVTEALNPYTFSKLEAEKALCDIFKRYESELIIVRPPLIYAANAPGNFNSLLKLVAKRIPLPFGSVTNSRSHLSIDNFVSFLVKAITCSQPCAGTYVLSDDEKLSTAYTLQVLSEGMGLKSNLFRFPYGILKLMAKIIGKGETLNKVCGDLVIDATKAKSVFNWQPPVPAQESLRKVGENYISLQIKNKELC